MPLSDQSITMAAGLDLYTGSLVPPAQLTFAMDDAAVVGAPASASISNASSAPSGPWSIPSVAGLAFSPSSGASIVTGAPQVIAVTATTGGSKAVILVCAGAAITGNPQVLAVTNPVILALTFSADDTGRVNTTASGLLQNTGSTALPWSITPPSNVSVVPSSGTLAAGASQSLAITPSAIGTYSLSVAAAGATISGNSQSIAVSPAYATQATITLPSTGTTGSQTSGTISLNGVGPSGGVTVTPAGTGATWTPASVSWAEGESGAAKAISIQRAADGSTSYSISNNRGLTNLGFGTYTSSAANSATPFRIERTGVRYANLKAAHDAAQDGDVIKVTAGTYTVDITGKSAGGLNTSENSGTNYGIYRASLTIEWETPGQMPVIDMSLWAADMAARGGDGSPFIMGSTCLNLTIRGIRVKGNTAPSQSTSGSGIRCQPGYASPAPAVYPTATLLVDRCYFDTFTNGIATGYNDQFSLDVRDSVFKDCGAADGLSHGMYVNSAAFLDVRGCRIFRTVGFVNQAANGHLIKSRATRTRIRGNFLDGTGGCACLIDFSNGGDVEVTGNLLIFHGAVPALTGDDTNPSMKFGAEQRAGANPNWGITNHTIKIAQNTIRCYQPQWNSSPSARREILWIYTTMTLQDGTPISVASIPQTIRNNIIGGIAGPVSAALWPDNAVVNSTSYRSTDTWDITDAGVYSGAPIAGSPLLAEAPFAYTAELTAASARVDTFRGGRITGTPAWRSAMAVNTWAAIGSSKMRDVDPEASGAINPNGAGFAAPWRGSNGQASILDAWGSAAWDEANLTLWVPLGGGHGNYFGNEPYKQDFAASGQPWVMPLAPTGAIGDTGSLAGNGTDSHFDGRPRSPHTYGNVVYAPSIGPVAVRLGFVDGSATSYQSVWRLNPSTGVPTKVYTFPSGGAPVYGCCYDPTRNRIYSITNLSGIGPLQWCVPDGTSSWSGSQIGSSTVWPGNYAQLTYLPVQDRLLLTTSTGGGNDVICQLIHPTTGAVTTLSITGSPPSGFDWIGGRAGIAWASSLGKLLLWNQTSTLGTVATLTPSGDGLTTWAWGSISAASGAPPVAASGNGTYSKFGYSDVLGGCYLQTTVDQPTYFFATR